MITIYTSHNSNSSRKAKAWLRKYQLPFIEQNVFTAPLSYTAFKEIMARTENGTTDIISTRSKAYRQLKPLLDDDLSLRQLYDLIRDYPGLLRRPLIIDERRLQIGYNVDDIRQFLPRKIRRLELIKALRRSAA